MAMNRWKGASVLILLGALAAPMVSACGEAAPTVSVERAFFRTQGDHFEIDRGNGWEKFTPVGVNLGIGTPGLFPSEFYHDADTYYGWLNQIADLNANVVRLYTLHSPSFYEALDKWNNDHPDKVVYLIQGIWLDEPEEEHQGIYYIGEEATSQMDQEIEYVVDAVHGRADIGLRLGKAFGEYRHDVSSWTMGWLIGHEMLGFDVLESNDAFEQYTYYEGIHVRMESGLPIEGWVARFLDYVVTYELDRYSAQRPVAFSSWPVLDPMIHPTETAVFGQDLVQADFAKFETVPPFTAGIYASYHVYPFNPEFIIYQPDYADTTDGSGKVNSYFGYLIDLKNHHAGVPLLISEFGVPSSMGVAHYNQSSYNHGGYDEEDQSISILDQYISIMEAGCAGAIVFEFMDEWFKRTWVTRPVTLPWERGRLWYDVISPEESFGLISYYPLPGLSITVDAKPGDWKDRGVDLAHQEAAALSAGEAASSSEGEAASSSGGNDDPARTITGVWAAADPSFLFLRIDTAADEPAMADTVWYVALSTVGGKTGDVQLPGIDVKLPASAGAESVVVLDGRSGEFRLLTDAPYDPTPHMNGESPDGGVPKPNGDGLYSMASFLVNHNMQYKNEAKSIIPEIQYYTPSILNKGNSDVDNQVHFQVGKDGIIEIRLPWLALWVTDPSSRQVLSDDIGTEGFDTVTTDGIGIVVAVARLTEDDTPQLVDVLPRKGFKDGVVGGDIPMFTWDTWEVAPDYEPRLKEAYHGVRKIFGEVQR